MSQRPGDRNTWSILWKGLRRKKPDTSLANRTLETHRISTKSITGRDGVVRKVYSIQFTYPAGRKKQFTGKTVDEVRQKVYQYFRITCITYRELCERWLGDSNLTDSEKKVTGYSCLAINKFISYVGEKLAAGISPEEFKNAGKNLLQVGQRREP